MRLRALMKRLAGARLGPDCWMLSLAAMAFFCLGVPVTHAATIIVSNTNDSGSGSLRQAISSAAAGDTINFSVTGTITLTSGSLNIDKNLTITGPGLANLAVDGNNAFAVFNVNAVAVYMAGFTIQHGSGGDGGGIYNDGGLTLSQMAVSNNTAASRGGGIYNIDTLTISDSIVDGNSATGTYASGGGIYSSGTVTATNLTVSNNSAVMDGGGILNSNDLTITNGTISNNTALGGKGGGIYSANIGSNATLTNVTITENLAPGAGGGGVAANHYGVVTLTNVTIAGNSASQGGGILVLTAASVSIRNSIVAGNTGGNCLIYQGSGAITSNGNNIDSGTTCGWGSANGSMSSTNPLLEPLADNGGPTDTMALLPGSPAIDGVTFNSPNGAPATDQRGIIRPSGGGYDIGAYEYAMLDIFPSSNSGGTVVCSPNPVEPHGDSVCTMTPTNSTPNNYHVSGVSIRPFGFLVWFSVDPTTKYVFDDLVYPWEINVTFAPTNIWLYRKLLFEVDPWEYQTTRHTIADAMFYAAVHYPLTDTLRIPSGAFNESGGISCMWSIDVTFSGGWTSGTVRDSTNPMSTIAGPLTVRNSCTLTMDGITVE